MRALCVVAVMAVGSAHAGVTLTFERVREGKTSQMVVQMDGAKARTETASSADAKETVVVWDGDAKALLTLRPGEKTYSRMDEASMAASRDRLKAMKDKMDAQMTKMTPEQRAQMEQVMKGRGPGSPAESPKLETKITATGKKQKVGKFSCEIYERVIGELKQEVCVAPWDKSPVSKDDLKPLQSLAEFTASMLGPAATPSSTYDPMTELGRYQGFPVQTTSTDATGASRTFTLTNVTRGAVDKEAFAVPAGYTEKKSPM